MIKNIFASLALYVVCLAFICIYCGVVYFAGHTFWESNAKGSLIYDENKKQNSAKD